MRWRGREMASSMDQNEQNMWSCACTIRGEKCLSLSVKWWTIATIVGDDIYYINSLRGKLLIIIITNSLAGHSIAGFVFFSDLGNTPFNPWRLKIAKDSSAFCPICIFWLIIWWAGLEGFPIHVDQRDHIHGGVRASDPCGLLLENNENQ